MTFLRYWLRQSAKVMGFSPKDSLEINFSRLLSFNRITLHTYFYVLKESNQSHFLNFKSKTETESNYNYSTYLDRPNLTYLWHIHAYRGFIW